MEAPAVKPLSDGKRLVVELRSETQEVSCPLQGNATLRITCSLNMSCKVVFGGRVQTSNYKNVHTDLDVLMHPCWHIPAPCSEYERLRWCMAGNYQPPYKNRLGSFPEKRKKKQAKNKRNKKNSLTALGVYICIFLLQLDNMIVSLC